MPTKASIEEYCWPFVRHLCASSIRLLAREIEYVDETPGMDQWWKGIIVPADHEPRDCPSKHYDKAYQGESHASGASSLGLWCYLEFSGRLSGMSRGLWLVRRLLVVVLRPGAG